MSSISKSIGSPLVLSTPDISKEPFRRTTLVMSMPTGSGSLFGINGYNRTTAVIIVQS